MKKYRIHNGELWVLVSVYLTPSGFVAHWFGHNGAHWHEPLKVQLTR